MSRALPRSARSAISIWHVTRVIPKIVIPADYHSDDLPAHRPCTIYLKIACTIDCRYCILSSQVHVSRTQSNGRIKEFPRDVKRDGVYIYTCTLNRRMNDFNFIEARRASRYTILFKYKYRLARACNLFNIQIKATCLSHPPLSHPTPLSEAHLLCHLKNTLVR